MRTFRVWRVQSVELHRPSRCAARPTSTWPTTWQKVVAEMDERRGSARVHALADPDASSARSGATSATGSRWARPPRTAVFSIDIGFAEDHDPSMELAGYGAGLEVLEPPEVRASLAEIGALLVDRYGAA